MHAGEQADDAIGAGAEAVQLGGGAVVQHVPRLATKALALDAARRTGCNAATRYHEALRNGSVMPPSSSRVIRAWNPRRDRQNAVGAGRSPGDMLRYQFETVSRLARMIRK